MFVILLTANFKFRNRSTCSKGPMKRAGKVCGDSQDLESPGYRKFFDWEAVLSVKGCIRCIVFKWVKNTNSLRWMLSPSTDEQTNLKIWKLSCKIMTCNSSASPITVIWCGICLLISAQQCRRKLLLKSSLPCCNNLTAHFNQVFCVSGSTYSFQSLYSKNPRIRTYNFPF